ncbi:DUF4065 domain-containing protein (plasmid) [Exiguobacterium acetylicum]|uniref:Panacea domain-containing protein n=1 Tax=Exiguobacterium acetylicum TaxID=41170 RepID=UPI0035A5DA47
MARAIDVANYLIYLQNRDSEHGQYFSLSNLKLQKIMYYCQGGHYKWDSERLIDDNLFEAWQYGPVISEVYFQYKHFGQNDIKLAHIPNEDYFNSVFSENEIETIDAIWDQLKDYSAFDLVESSHNELPWLEARKNSSSTINEDTIEQFFAEESEGF